jgi:hypothetical protein
MKKALGQKENLRLKRYIIIINIPLSMTSKNKNSSKDKQTISKGFTLGNPRPKSKIGKIKWLALRNI